MKKFQISKQVLIAACIIVLAALAVATGGVIAKYVKTVGEDESEVTAKTFYFESDYLLPTAHTYELNSTTNSVSFELRNFENEDRVSQVNCTYEVTIESDDSNFTVKVNDGESASLTTLTLDAAEKVKTTHIITLEKLQPGETYAVRVTAKGGYQKTLSATFQIAEEKNGFYMNVEETETYVLLTVWTEGDLKGNVTVNVPAGLIPDVTDSILKNITNYDPNSGTYGAVAFVDTTSFASTNASRTYRFFKATGYTSGTFTVKIGDTPAKESSIP